MENREIIAEVYGLTYEKVAYSPCIVLRMNIWEEGSEKNAGKMVCVLKQEEFVPVVKNYWWNGKKDGAEYLDKKLRGKKFTLEKGIE